MNKTQLLIVLVVVSLALTFSVFGKTWENVSLTDKMCSTKFKDNPDSHAASCMLKTDCVGSGFGILTEEAFLKFDGAGNEKAEALLKSTDKKDHIRVTVSGDLNEGTIQVESLSLTGK